MMKVTQWIIVAGAVVLCSTAMPVDKSAESPKTSDAENGGNEYNDNPELYQGDMMGMDEAVGRNALISQNALWRYKTVYYRIENEFSEEDRLRIEEGIQEYHRKTCIRFVPLPDTPNRPPWMEDYVFITSRSTGCHSWVGRRGTQGGQQVNLQSPGCMSRGTIVHELMHALGFGHEQSRPDRDKWVTIDWRYIPQDKRNNFDIYPWSQATISDVPYDFESVMHYGPLSFTNVTGMPTIIPKEGNPILGQREGFSFHDIQKINRRYSCT